MNRLINGVFAAISEHLPVRSEDRKKILALALLLLASGFLTAMIVMRMNSKSKTSNSQAENLARFSAERTGGGGFGSHGTDSVSFGGRLRKMLTGKSAQTGVPMSAGNQAMSQALIDAGSQQNATRQAQTAQSGSQNQGSQSDMFDYVAYPDSQANAQGETAQKTPYLEAMQSGQYASVAQGQKNQGFSQNTAAPPQRTAADGAPPDEAPPQEGKEDPRLFFGARSGSAGSRDERAGGVNTVRGAAGDGQGDSSTGRATDASFGGGMNFQAKAAKDFAGDDLRYRTDIAQIASSAGSPDQASGAVATAWGEEPKNHTSLSGGKSGGVSGSGVQFDKNISAPITAPNKTDEKQEKLGAYWTFAWRPILIEADSNCEDCAKKEVEAKWDAWLTKSPYTDKKLGSLGAISKDIEKIKSAWDPKNHGLYNSLFNFLGVNYCKSWYSGVNVTIYHPDYFPGGKIIKNCTDWIAPPPFSLSECVPSKKMREGFESAYPPDPVTSKPTMPDISAGGIPGLQDGFPELPEIKSDFYRGSEKWVENENKMLCGGTHSKTNEIACEMKAISGSVKEDKKSTDSGEGIFKLTYGICTKCESNNETPRRDYWPSIYFNLVRNFDGSPGYDKRCLPANTLMAAGMIKCNIAANEASHTVCSAAKIREYMEKDKDFRKNVTQTKKGETAQSVCEEHIGIPAAVDQCINGGGDISGFDKYGI